MASSHDQEALPSPASAGERIVKAGDMAVAMFLVSSFISLIGANAVTYYATVVFTQEITGSNTLAGTFFFLNFLPSFALTLYSGVLLDRYSRKKILLAAYGIYSVSTGLFAWLAIDASNSALTLFFMGVASLLTGIGLATAQTARFAFLGSLVPQARIRSLTVALNLLIILGFCVSPVAVEWAKVHLAWAGAFLGMSTLFVAAALILLTLVPEGTRPAPSGVSADSSSVLREFGRGARFVGDTLAVRNLLLMGLVPLCLLGAVQVAVPAIGTEILHTAARGRALLMSAFGLGLILGSVGSIPLISHPRLRQMTMLLHFVSCALVASLPVLAQAGGASAVGVTLAIMGMVVGFFGVVLPAHLQTRIPDALRGRVMGIYSLLFLGVPGTSGLVVGALADQLGPLGGLSLLAALLLAYSGAMVMRRYFDVPAAD
jgi:MFS family permease